jgi:hypothetical protein
LIFTAYFDESDTHGPAPNLILAAFLGSARQWELFRRKIKALQRRDGFTVFHATDFKAGAREFRGWSHTKRMRLVNDIATAIRVGLTEGVTITLPRKLYEEEYRAQPVPKGMPLDSQFGVCFRVCMHRLVNLLTADRKIHKLNVVVEDGHPNVKNTVVIFNALKAETDTIGVHILGTITIAKKAECWPLMIADFQAHASSISEARMKSGLTGYFDMTHGTLPKRGEAGLTQIQCTPESLRGLKTSWEQANQDRITKWRAARDARRDTASQ